MKKLIVHLENPYCGEKPQKRFKITDETGDCVEQSGTLSKEVIAFLEEREITAINLNDPKKGQYKTFKLGDLSVKLPFPAVMELNGNGIEDLKSKYLELKEYLRIEGDNNVISGADCVEEETTTRFIVDCPGKITKKLSNY